MPERITQNELDQALGEPCDLNWAVENIYRQLDEESINNIKAADDMHGFHFGAGMRIRNTYGLWGEDNPLVQWFTKELGVVHGDDRSGILMEALWHRVRELPYDPAPTIERYRQHWARAGYNLDQTKIEE
ncbi:MAG: hypothetical protein JSS66_07100 [Armatimonadetes bacterium]|nr:hypothetical protein [Armatimonadota bacterium]